MNSKKWLIVILLICVLIGIILLKPKNNTTQVSSEDTVDVVNQEMEPAPIVAEKELQPVSVTIISPEEETFIPRQARMWKAQVNNFVSDIGSLGICEWRFYLNENNEEVLYKEQETKVVLSTGGDNSCAFTSTFIEKRGKLRAEVTIHVKDMQDNILETFVSERSYIVQ